MLNKIVSTSCLNFALLQPGYISPELCCICLYSAYVLSECCLFCLHLIYILLNPAYLQHRAQTLGDPAEAATHGDPVAVLGGEALGALGPDTTLELAGTTHFSIVDAEGNAVSSTMTVEGPFGSSRWASGFVLNNEMTDFARVYVPEAPEPANAVRPDPIQAAPPPPELPPLPPAPLPGVPD